MDKLSPLLFEAIAMYKANETTKRGFTKDSIKPILLTVFGIAPPNSGKLSSKSEVEVITATGQGQSQVYGQPSCF
jgi:hypothetical protein